MAVMWSVELIVIAAMIGFNSLFAAYEIALASVSLARLRLLNTENRRGAAAALFMKENMEGSLATVQLGITLVGAVAAATGGAGAGEQIAPWLRDQYGFSEELAEFFAIAVVVVPMTAITIVFGELVPKVFALRNKEWVCMRMSPAMRWFSAGVWPAVWLFEAVVVGIMKWSEKTWRPTVVDGRSEAAELQELRASAALARTSRLIGPREERIILGAARLNVIRESDSGAELEDDVTDGFRSSPWGQTRILWKEPGLGMKWAVVRLGDRPRLAVFELAGDWVASEAPTTSGESASADPLAEFLLQCVHSVGRAVVAGRGDRADQLDRHRAVAVRDGRGGREPLDHRQLREILGPAGLKRVLATGGLASQVAVIRRVAPRATSVVPGVVRLVLKVRTLPPNGTRHPR